MTRKLLKLKKLAEKDSTIGEQLKSLLEQASDSPVEKMPKK